MKLDYALYIGVEVDTLWAQLAASLLPKKVGNGTDLVYDVIIEYTLNRTTP